MGDPGLDSVAFPGLGNGSRMQEVWRRDDRKGSVLHLKRGASSEAVWMQVGARIPLRACAWLGATGLRAASVSWRIMEGLSRRGLDGEMLADAEEVDDW